jgi:hypothetical protein
MLATDILKIREEMKEAVILKYHSGKMYIVLKC